MAFTVILLTYLRVQNRVKASYVMIKEFLKVHIIPRLENELLNNFFMLYVSLDTWESVILCCS